MVIHLNGLSVRRQPWLYSILNSSLAPVCPVSSPSTLQGGRFWIALFCTCRISCLCHPWAIPNLGAVQNWGDKAPFLAQGFRGRGLGFSVTSSSHRIALLSPYPSVVLTYASVFRLHTLDCNCSFLGLSPLSACLRSGS